MSNYLNLIKGDAIELHRKGVSNYEIAKKLKISTYTLKIWLEEYKQTLGLKKNSPC